MTPIQKGFWSASQAFTSNSQGILWIMLLLTFFVGPMLTINLVQLETATVGVKKSQIIGFSKAEITNYYNYQYYAKMELGNPPQRFDVILDTGSHLLWVPTKNCSNCPDDVRKFESAASTTIVPLPLRDHIRYGRGEVYGYYIFDSVLFQGVTSTLKLLLVDKQSDTQHSQADGIMGLSNLKSVSNIFDVAYKNKEIVSPKFGFQLGIKELKQPSYFIYNFTDEDYPEAVYINATSRDYWTIPARAVSIGNLTYFGTKALVDSGTSLILLPPKLFNGMYEQYFRQHCSLIKGTKTRKCKCPHEVQYPNLTILSSSLEFNITPYSYISGSYNRKYCILGIESVPSSVDFMILGDIFFHGKTIIFDKQKNQIGFISNAKTINVYPNSQIVDWIFNVIAVLALVSAVFILMMRRKRGKTLEELAEGLQNGRETQLASLQ